MANLTKRDFQEVKDNLKNGRISPDMIRFGLGAFMLFSSFMVGIAYFTAVASDSLIGWENLTVFWKAHFKLQALLFIVQLILIIFIKGKSNWSQIVLNISYVVFTYKTALDPFVMVSMFAMDAGEYEVYGPMMLLIIIFAFLLQIYMIRRYFLNLQEEKRNSKQARKEKKSRRFLFYVTPLFFLLASITGFIISNDLLGDMDFIFIIGIAAVVMIGILIGMIEYLIGAYCVIRFPSFRVNPPKEK